MAKKNKLKELRFGVGSPEANYSSTWKVWTKKGETYLAPREIGSTMKVSLHRSGRWRIGFSSKAHSGDDDRALLKWNPPQETEVGWTHALSIVVPSPRDTQG